MSDIEKYLPRILKGDYEFNRTYLDDGNVRFVIRFHDIKLDIIGEERLNNEFDRLILALKFIQIGGESAKNTIKELIGKFDYKFDSSESYF